VRRGVYILLVVFLVQLSGLRALCLPSHSQTHACCPMGAKTTLPNSPSLPECCLTSLLNYQASITETQNAVDKSELTAQSGTVSIPPKVHPFVTRTQVRQIALPSISPPLSPLAQSCLLLI